jgi:hypothetical protein
MRPFDARPGIAHRHAYARHSVSGGFDVIPEVAVQSINELDATIDVIGEVDGIQKPNRR